MLKMSKEKQRLERMKRKKISKKKNRGRCTHTIKMKKEK